MFPAYQATICCLLYINATWPTCINFLLCLKFVVQNVGSGDSTILSDGDGCLEPAVEKKQKHSYESVSLPEGNL